MNRKSIHCFLAIGALTLVSAAPPTADHPVAARRFRGMYGYLEITA